MNGILEGFTPVRTGFRTMLILTLLVCFHPFNLQAGEASSASEETRQVDKLFSGFNDGLQPGVAVMVIHEGAVVHSKGYGYANLEKKTPITPESTFRLGSVSKQFTAMAIAILADKEKLDY